MAKAGNKNTGKSEEKNINSKGYRKNFVKGVVGWQDAIKMLRTGNNSQIALSLLGEKHPVSDTFTKQAIAAVKKSKVKIPKGLQSRIDTVKDLTVEPVDTSSYKKAIKKAILQLEFADDSLTKELHGAIQRALAKCSKVSKSMRSYM